MGNFKFTEIELEGVYIIEPKVFADERGYFLESYCKEDFYSAGLTMEFVQDNESKSKKGVLRGMHFQTEHSQGKLVRVIKGTVYDVAIDLRKDSKTYGKWYGVILSEENKKQFYIPQNFAHGFLVLSEEVIFTYKCTDYYYPQYDCGLIWNDPNIGVKWPIEDIGQIILSEKDRKHKTLKELEKENVF